MPDTLRYTVTVPDPVRRIVAVELELPASSGEPWVLAMPAWTPGSYVIREYARQVDGVEARTAGGRRVRVRRLSKDRWEIAAPARSKVTVSWRLYGNEISVRTNHVDDTHAFLQPTGTFLGPVDGTDRPIDVEVDAPAGWDVSCSLERKRARRRGTVRFHAPDRETLDDSPLLLGHLRKRSFKVRGIAHEISLWGTGNEDPRQVATDLEAIVEAGAKLFRGLPYERYVVQGLLTDSGGGGLEHREGFVYQTPRWLYRPQKNYDRVLSLLAHEFFHAWNVRRIRPAGLLPYDLSEEKYTRLLWQFEGVTSYYAVLLLRRAGLWDRERALRDMAERIAAFESVPGRRRITLADSSLTTWVKLYRPDENTFNTYVSYYLKGELAGIALDLHVRAESDGKKSYDDVMRLLWRRFGRTDEPVPEDAMPALIREATGVDVGRLHRRLVESTSDPDWARLFAPFGVEVEREPLPGPEGYEPGGWLGVVTKDEGGRTKFDRVRDDGPAAGSLAAGDELVALDGLRCTKDTLSQRLAERAPGTTVRFTVLRGDRLVEADVRLGAPPRGRVKLVVKDRPTKRQARLLRGWLGR